MLPVEKPAMSLLSSAPMENLLKMLRGLVLLSFLSVGKSQECAQINISCPDIKTDNGFKFELPRPQPGREHLTIEVTHNTTKIAQGPPFVYTNDVMSMDHNSITTTDCGGLHVKYIAGGGTVKESCYVYETTEIRTSSEPSPSPNSTDLLFSESIVKVPPWVGPLIIGIIGIIGMAGMFYCWKKKENFRELVSNQLERLRLRTSPAGTGESFCDPDLRACEDNNRNVKLESVLSIDRAPDAEAPQSFSLDRTPSSGRIQEPKNGDVRAPDVNRASNHRRMRRNTRDDPGGVTENKGKGIPGNRETRNGWTRGDRGPEDESGRQPLLSDARAAIPDVTGEAGLVYERGTERVRWSCRPNAQPDADVESTLDMKNTMTDNNNKNNNNNDNNITYIII